VANVRDHTGTPRTWAYRSPGEPTAATHADQSVTDMAKAAALLARPLHEVADPALRTEDSRSPFRVAKRGGNFPARSLHLNDVHALAEQSVKPPRPGMQQTCHKSSPIDTKRRWCGATAPATLLLFS